MGMGVLYVTSLNAGDGKTAFCSSISHLVKTRGNAPFVFKATSLDRNANNLDAMFYSDLHLNPLNSELPIPTTPEEGLTPAIRELILEEIHKVSSQGYPVIIEGPPILVKETVVTGAHELVDALDAKVVIITNHDQAIPMSRIAAAGESFGENLLGIVINSVRRYQRHAIEESLIPDLTKRDIPVLGIVPEDRALLGVTVGQIVAHLDGELLLNANKENRLVDNVMIGGNVMDWAVNYFGQSETKAVIVRGDRPDIQIAALHTPTRCLVLTGGHRPLQYIAHEATEEEVPLVVVQSNTLDTAKIIETMFDVATVHHQEKTERFAETLARHLDTDSLLATFVES